MPLAIVERLLAAAPRAVSRSAGETLFRQGDAVRGLFVIEEGLAELVRHGENGTRVVLQRARAGDILAEASAFASHYGCDALAVGPVRAAFVSRETISSLLAELPFARELAEHLAGRVHELRARAELLSLRTVAERLNAWLALNEGRIPPHGARKALATDLGVTPEALYRELARRR